MKEAEFLRQLSFLPQFEEGQTKSFQYDNVIVGGMGGSALPAKILFFLDPVFPLWLHDDYDLPEKSDNKTLFVAISYSGETRETLSFASKVLERNLPLIVISSGGVLTALAQEHDLPRVIIPGGLQPRNATLYMLRALLFVTGHEAMLKELENVGINFGKLVQEGKEVASHFHNEIPLVYSSRRNGALSVIWKIMLTESGKMPVFTNVFPELTHNEVQGIVPVTAGERAKIFKTLLLVDAEDDERIRRSMSVFLSMAAENDIKTETLELPSGKAAKLLSTLVQAHAAAVTLVEERGVDPDSVPFIESFKKLLWPK